jgi:hypothetical protein
MDNKQAAESLALDFAGVLKFANNIIKKVETGNGMNIPDDKMDEFKQQVKDSGADKLIAELKMKMEDFKKLVNNSNHGANHKAKQ